MLLIQCVTAYAALVPMAEKEWDYKTAHGLLTLKRRLQGHVEFFTKEEMKLVEEYGEKDKEGKILWTEGGGFRFRDPGKAEEYAAKRRELGAVEIQESWKPIRLPIPDRIKPVQIEALEGFVIWEEGG